MCRKALECVVGASTDEQIDLAQVHLAAMVGHLNTLEVGRVQRLVGLGLVVGVLEGIIEGTKPSKE